jgi:carboxypeptidase family protein/putative zinc finger protein
VNVKHLSTEQLSAHLDHALTGRAAEEAERHLVGCAACREALASLAAQDASLRPALTHDPGEAYFESFPARVEARLRASGLAGAQTRGTGFDPGRFLASPRALAWAGAVAVVVVGAGLALMTGREVRPPDLRDRDLSERGQQVAPGGANAIGEKDQSAQAPPAAALEKASPASRADVAGREPGGAAQMKEGTRATREELAAPVADERAVRAQKDRSAKAKGAATANRFAAPPAVSRQAPGVANPSHAVEVQRNAAGEDAPVRTEAGAAPLSDATAPSAEQAGQVRKKSAAEPLKAGAARFLIGGPAKTESTAGASSFAIPSPASSAGAKQLDATTSTTSKLAIDGLAAGEARLCGEVRDPAGRPLAGAQVTLIDANRTTTTDARGAFCLAAPAGEHALSVMAVGFYDSRQTVRVGGEEAVVRVTLAAVSVMDDKRGAVSGRVPLPRLPATTPAEPRDNYSALPDTVRSVVRAAQVLESGARSRRSASLFDAAAAGWERALKRLPDGPLALETRWHLAEARYHAWEAGPNSRRATAAVDALTAYVARAPAGAERSQATRWLDQVRH